MALFVDNPSMKPAFFQNADDPLEPKSTTKKIIRFFSKFLSSSEIDKKTTSLEMVESKRAKILRNYIKSINDPNNMKATLYVGSHLGIQNAYYSCTIASLIFNMFSFYASNKLFLHYLLKFKTSDSEETKAIKYALMDIVVRLANVKEGGFVPWHVLANLRYLVMPIDAKKTGFLDPDEFLTYLFAKLQIPFDVHFSKIFFPIDCFCTDKQIVSTQDLIDKILIERSKIPYNDPLIDENHCRVLIMQVPSQGCKASGIEKKKAYKSIFPSMDIAIGSNIYRLHSFLVNLNANHYTSYVLNHYYQKVFLFNSQFRIENDEALPTIEAINGLYRILTEKISIEDLVHQDPAHYSDLKDQYNRLTKNISFLIYTKKKTNQSFPSKGKEEI